MKIRQGFVSNSSTASFIVFYKDFFSNKSLLSREEVKKLEKKGFFKTDTSYPDQLCELQTDLILKTDYYNYGYLITVNEFEILEWLLKNKIPFVADCHYGQYTVVHERDSKYVDVFVNAGMHYLMHINKTIDLLKKPCAKRFTVKTFLFKGYYI